MPTIPTLSTHDSLTFAMLDDARSVNVFDRSYSSVFAFFNFSAVFDNVFRLIFVVYLASLDSLITSSSGLTVS